MEQMIPFSFSHPVADRFQLLKGQLCLALSSFVEFCLNPINGKQKHVTPTHSSVVDCVYFF